MIRPNVQWIRCSTLGCRGYAGKDGICPPCGKRGRRSATPEILAARARVRYSLRVATQ